MPKVKFLRDAEIVIDGVLTKYKAGEVYDLREDRAQRWKKREAAEDYVEPPKVEKSRTIPKMTEKV